MVQLQLNLHFPSPVYIQNNVEHCFVVIPNSQDYNAYVARIGETSLDSSRTISAQPYVKRIIQITEWYDLVC